MIKAIRLASFGTKRTREEKCGGRISDSLLGEKNVLTRAERLKNHKSQGIPRIQLTRTSNARQKCLDMACLEGGNIFWKRK